MALTEHAWYQNHTFNFDDVTIFDGSNIYKKEMILEMTHIASNPHTVNRRTDTGHPSFLLIKQKHFTKKPYPPLDSIRSVKHVQK